MNIIIVFLITLPIWAIPLALFYLLTGQFSGIVFFLLLTPLHSLGITLGYHRLLAHRAFTPPNWLKVTLVLLGALNLQGPPIAWCSVHLKHHQFPDTDKDPHSPIHGFWHAYIGWLFDFGFAGHQGVRRLAQDPFLRWVERYYLPLNAAYMLVFALMGWSVFFWAVIMRMAYINHLTWLVNALGHTGGKACNRPFFSYFTFGEGMHANHHQKPGAAQFAEGTLDLGYLFLVSLLKHPFKP